MLMAKFPTNNMHIIIKSREPIFSAFSYMFFLYSDGDKPFNF